MSLPPVLDTGLFPNRSSAPLLLSPTPADSFSPRHGQRPPAADTAALLSSASSSTLPTPTTAKVPQDEYGPFTAYCFTVNYILGVGVLGMPFAFVKAGYVLSTLCLLLVTVMATLTALWLSEVGVRAARLEQRALRDMNADLRVPLAPVNGDAVTVVSPAPSSPRHRRIEMNELVDIFLGKRARRVYELLLCVYMIGALWSYTAVFSQSLATQLPISGVDNSYVLYLLIFAVIVLPLTCMEMTELKPLAISLAIFRFVSLGMMILTSLLALFHYPYVDNSTSPPTVPSSASSAPYVSDIRAVVAAGLATVFPVSIYSQIFHHSVPGLSHPLRAKSQLPAVFSSVLLTTFSLYAALGITVGLYYGSSVRDVCTLSWTHYTGERDDGGSSSSGRSPVAAFISYLIVLFPPIDIVSAFPLNCITLANNIMSACIPPHLHTQRRYIIPFRLVAACLPLIGAGFVKSLDSILHYTGCVGVLIAFLFPLLLQYKSIKVDREEDGQQEQEGGHEAAGHRTVVLSGWQERWVNGRLAMGTVGVFSVVGLISVIVLSFID